MTKKQRPSLTRLELEVVQALWAEPARSLTVREVLERVNQPRKQQLAYTTVLTVLSILKRKGVVRVQAGPGRAHTFRPRLSRSEVTTSMVSDLLDRLFGGRAQPLLQHLIEHEQLSPGEIKEMKQWIDSRLEDDPGESR
jgi:predicted transcriptional regulator